MALYAAAVLAVWRVLRGWPVQGTPSFDKERWFWRLLVFGLLLLGINKQLDLQSAVTELGRISASEGGWYNRRQQVQEAFIAGIALMGLTLFAMVLQLVWRAPRATHVALAGTAGLFIFVVIRAASFHHVDAWLGQRVGGVRMNWLLEMGGLAIIIAASLKRLGRH